MVRVPPTWKAYFRVTHRLSYSYCNSVLQALYFCHPFRDLVLQTPDKSNPLVPPLASPSAPPQPTPSQIPTRAKNVRKSSAMDTRAPVEAANGQSSAPLTGPPIPPSPPTLFSALRSLFLHISQNSLDKGTVAPRAFIDKLKKENELFRSSMHQDAHEFLNYLLNSIAEDLEQQAKEESHSSFGAEDRESCYIYLSVILINFLLTSFRICLFIWSFDSRNCFDIWLLHVPHNSCS